MPDAQGPIPVPSSEQERARPGTQTSLQLPGASACRQQNRLEVQRGFAIISTFRNFSQEGKKGKPEIITHTGRH